MNFKKRGSFPSGCMMWAIVFILFRSVVATTNAQSISTVGEIYDFDVGDIYHSWNYVAAWPGNGYDRYIKVTILDKFYSANNSKVHYVRSVAKKEIYYGDTAWTYSFYIDTLGISGLNNLIVGGDIDSVYSDPTYCNGRVTNYRMTMGSDYTHEERWVVGCGFTYNVWINYDPDYVSSYELIYYKKGNETWGNPLPVSVAEHNIPVSRPYIVPNPASSTIRIMEAGTPVGAIEIYDGRGRFVKTMPAGGSTGDIDISDLATGLYLIRMVDASNTILKLIKLP